jgi:hypothetical protein
MDNQSAIQMIKNSKGLTSYRTKHIDTKFHFIREKYERGEIGVDYVCSENQVADILTKALGRLKFEKLRDCMGLSSVLHFSDGS